MPVSDLKQNIKKMHLKNDNPWNWSFTWKFELRKTFSEKIRIPIPRRGFHKNVKMTGAFWRCIIYLPHLYPVSVLLAASVLRSVTSTQLAAKVDENCKHIFSTVVGGGGGWLCPSSLTLLTRGSGAIRGGIKIKLEFCPIGEQLTLRGLTPK